MFARCLVLVALAALCSTAYADPQATRDDIEISRILNVPRGTVRIAKDPRTNVLYTLRQDGSIGRIDLAAAAHTPAYSRDDHGIRSGFTGFAIGPDGSFYLASNRRGPRDSGHFALARGILLDADTGERQWEQLDPNDLPTDVPIDDILAATNLSLDPTTNIRYALKTTNGDITLVPKGTVYTAADHGFTRPSALFIDADGTFYVLKRIDLSSYNIATITKGEIDPSNGERTWFTLAETAPYERCDCIFNHEVNGLAISPDDRSLFINSGSRTDHGEVQDGNRQFPKLRETALTAIVLRVPTDARDLVLPNNRDALRAEGFLFAEGLRNAYDLAFAPNGDLFATENGPDRDMAEELNWLRQGHHYGFPWRMGLEDTPQQFPDYDPASDFLLPARFTAVREGYYHNDPTYPPPPHDFTEPVINLGTGRRRLPRPSRRPNQRRQRRRRTLRYLHRTPLAARISIRRWTMLSPSRSKATASCLAGPRAIPTAMMLPARSTTPVKTCCTSTWPKSATTTRRASPASSTGFPIPLTRKSSAIAFTSSNGAVGVGCGKSSCRRLQPKRLLPRPKALYPRSLH